MPSRRQRGVAVAPQLTHSRPSVGEQGETRGLLSLYTEPEDHGYVKGDPPLAEKETLEAPIKEIPSLLRINPCF